MLAHKNCGISQTIFVECSLLEAVIVGYVSLKLIALTTE